MNIVCDLAGRTRHHRRSRSARRPAERGGAVSTADKIAFVDQLSAAGLPVIEVSAFVSPKWVPQMADAGEVFAGITRRPGSRYTALVPNLAGLERALAASVDEIAIFAASSETFSRKNINQTHRRVARARTRDVAEQRPARRAARARLPLDRVRVSVRRPGRRADGGDDGRTVCWSSASSRWRSATRLASRTRARWRACSRSCSRRHRPERLALHFHDTRGTALANVLAALTYGVTTFDASAGGLGGCPVRAGRGWQPRHRRSGLSCWMGWESRRECRLPHCVRRRRRCSQNSNRDVDHRCVTDASTASFES